LKRNEEKEELIPPAQSMMSVTKLIASAIYSAPYFMFSRVTHQSRSVLGGTDDEETKLKKSRPRAKKALQRL
jgi:hypothetical protein